MNNLSGPIDLIKKALQIFFKKENLVYFLKIYAVLLPFSIVSLVQENLIVSLEEILGVYAWLIPVALLLGLAYLIIAFWVGVSGILAIQNVVEGRIPSFKDTYLSAWGILARFAILQLVVGLITGLGFLLLIIPGILFMVWFYFSGFEMVTKGVGIKEAMGGSKKLTSGRFWKILGRFFVFGLFMMLVQIMLSIIPFGLGSAILPILGILFILPYFLLYKELSQ
jgi:hypothetical protein